MKHEYPGVIADDLETFYTLVRRTRSGVLDWLESLPAGVLNASRDDFAYGSLSGIYSHIASCYLVWLARGGVGEAPGTIQARSAAELRAVFTSVDEAVASALATFTAWDEPFVWRHSSGFQETLTRRWLILHPITHEFHHKGQALALARVLGHPHPGDPDTDLVTPAA